MNLKQRIHTDMCHYITHTLLFIKPTRFYKVHHKITSKQKSNESCLCRKKSIHQNTQGIMRNTLTVISPALILLTQLISVPIALNSHCQPQVWEARRCTMAHLRLRGGSAGRTPSLGEGEQDWPGGAEMCRDVCGTQTSWAAAWQLPLSLLWWGRQGCPRTALPPRHRHLCLRGEPLWDLQLDNHVLGGCFSCPPLLLRAAVVTCR